MRLARLAPPLFAILCLLSITGCASQTHSRRDAPHHRTFSSDKDGRYFNPVTRNFDPPPPFGPRSNGSLH